MDDDITSKVLKCADDTNLFWKIKQDGDYEHVQEDLDKLIKWSENGRCYVILVNVNVFTQAMGMKMCIIQWVVELVKNLGAIISADIKVSEQCAMPA